MVIKQIISKHVMRSRHCLPAFAGLICLLMSSGAFAQMNMGRSDSLVYEMDGQPDSVRTNILISLCEELKYNRPETAYEYGQQAIELAQSLNNPVQIGRAYKAVAEIYILWSLYDQSLDYLLLALDQFEEAGVKQEIASCCDNIGVVYMSAGKYQNASTYYRRAWDLNREIINHSQMVRNLVNTGTNFVKQDSVEKGLNYYTVAYIIADSLNMTEEG